jgi:hypothetical protein
MRQLNGVYTQATNRRHVLVGHLFQGRFKAILVERDAYLLELARYVVLNPVRAGMAPAADADRSRTCPTIPTAARPWPGASTPRGLLHREPTRSRALHRAQSQRGLSLGILNVTNTDRIAANPDIGAAQVLVTEEDLRNLRDARRRLTYSRTRLL